MGVKPVEYKHDSSTAGFAKEGDKVEINKSDANTIEKDKKQGFVDLDTAQQKYLGEFVDEDKIAYTADENKNIGKNQINTKNTKKSDAGEATADVASSAGNAVGLAFAKPLVEGLKSSNHKITASARSESTRLNSSHQISSY